MKIKPEENTCCRKTIITGISSNACARARRPVSNIDSAVQSDFISHLCDIAIRTGRKIRWDPKTETIVGDEAAARMTRRAMRAPWTL